MPRAQHVVNSFLGGEISQTAQGRFDRPDYHTSLNVCLNAFPLEIGAWTRRPGTAHAGTTLNGLPGRVLSFAFQQTQPVTIELTDGNLRTWQGLTLLPGTIATPWAGGSWATLRMVQADTTAFLLQGTVAPQALVATPGSPPTFTLNPATFNDGPYLDPFTNGAQLTPGAKSGIVSLTLAFAAYNSATAYAKGAFITSASVNYVSLQDQNVGNTPASSPSFWQATSAGAAINNGQGFLGTDVGRLIRLFSEPPAWASGTAYSAGNVVSYNPSGTPGATTYWQALGSTTGNPPGSDITHWQLMTVNGAAVWTWGKIVSLTNIVSRAAGTAIGNMTLGGGLAGAFNGNFSQAQGASAVGNATGSSIPFGTTLEPGAYVGKNYGGQQISQVTVYPATDIGFGAGSYSYNTISGTAVQNFSPSFVLNLRGKGSAPSSPSDGTLLGTVGPMPNTTTAVTITSSDQTTAWGYVWVELVPILFFGMPGGAVGTSAIGYSFFTAVAQLSVFSPTGTGTSSGISVEILGPALLYSSPITITNWRLGKYSNTTGWPNVGCKTDGGRLWLSSAAFPNEFDACYANGFSGGTVNFAPTDQYGVVTDAHAISETFDADNVNPIQWMLPVQEGIIMGTQEGERLVFAPGQGAISPLNIDSRRLTKIGSDFVLPVRTEHTNIFPKRYGRKLMEFFPDVYSGRYTAPNLADKAAHLTTGVVVELAYTEGNTPLVWGRCEDGSWFSITYKRDTLTTSQGPTFYAWAEQTLGTGRTVESICAGPSVGGDLDTLVMVTSDGITRHVEILTDVPAEDATLQGSWFLDDAVNPSSVTITGTGAVINGLSHLEGLTVQVFTKGLDLGDNGDEGTTPTDFVVSGGSITVPYGDGVSAGPGAGLFTQAFASALEMTDIVVGCTYNSDGQIVRPMGQAQTGSRAGPGLGMISRDHFFVAQLVNTLGISFGTNFSSLRPALFRKDNPPTDPIDAFTMFSGLYGDAADGDYSRFDERLCWRVSRPFPATVVALGISKMTTDQ